MKSTQRLVFFILLFMLVACDKEIFKSRGIGFPLRQSWVFKTEGNVTAVSGLGNWIAVGTTEDLNAIDANNGHTIWSTKFPVSSQTSSLAISNNAIVAANFEMVKAFGTTGKELWSIDLLKPDRGSANIVAISEKYIFIIRTVSWYLEVYNSNTGKLVWDVDVPRGNSSVYFDPNKTLVYVLTPNSIEIHNADTGSLLQALQGKFKERILSDNILYYFSEGDDSASSYFSAYDLNSRSEIWKTPFSGEAHNLTVLNEMLIASTSTGVLAINPKNGQQIWQAIRDQDVFAPTLNLGDFFYAKGSLSKTVYALAIKTGDLTGYLQVEKAVTLLQPDEDYRSSILIVKNQLLFTSKNQVFAYGAK